MLVRPFAKQLAQRRDRLREIVLLDDRIAPHGIHELALGDDPAGVADQEHQGVEGAAGNRDRPLAAMRQQAPAGVEPEVAEGVKRLIRH